MGGFVDTIGDTLTMAGTPSSVTKSLAAGGSI